MSVSFSSQLPRNLRLHGPLKVLIKRIIAALNFGVDLQCAEFASNAVSNSTSPNDFKIANGLS